MTPPDESIYTPPGGPPQVPAPQGLWEIIGTEGLHRLSADMYRRLGHSSISAMFPEDLEAASRKQAAFLVGVLGGPPLYRERYGDPRMRARHLPFAIDEAARGLSAGDLVCITGSTYLAGRARAMLLADARDAERTSVRKDRIPAP